MKSQASILFWLLVAATIAANLVVIAWLSEDPMAKAAGVLYESLCFSQLSVAAIWLVFGERSRFVRLTALGSVLLAAAAPAVHFLEFTWPELLGFFGAYVTVLVIALWIFQHTSLAKPASAEHELLWQFSLGQLLVLMTIVGILMALLRGSELWIVAESVIVDIVTSTLLVVFVVATWTRPWRLPLRLASALGFAMLFGAATWAYDWWRADPLLDIRAHDLPMYLASGLIQAIVIYLWLEIARVIPAPYGCDDAKPSG